MTSQASCFVPLFACLFISNFVQDDRMMPEAECAIHCLATQKNMLPVLAVIG